MPDDTQNCPRCGASLQDTPVDGLCPGCLLRAGMDPPFEPTLLARLFPHLEVHELIGRGGMGAVYRARQRSLEREVALKLLPAHLAKEPGFPERFRREARALARLDHPNVVRVHEAGETEGHYYLVLEYVRGLNLRQLLQQRRLEPAEALALVPQICSALQYAHDHGIVHRDVKPENILLDADGRVKIADFGLARLSGRGEDTAHLTGTYQVMGTPRYMAPEQVEHTHAVDHRADIYSLGIVFYEMLTGELPMGRFEPPSQVVKVDVALDEVVLKTLERMPERRYQQAAEVKTAVEELGDGAPRAGAAVQTTAAENPNEDLEGMVWAVLCIAVPGLAYMGVVWADNWLPLLALFLPGVGLGSTFAHGAIDAPTKVFIFLVFVLFIGAIGGAMFTLQSATPLFALGVLLAGMAAGSEEERRKQAAKEARGAGT